MASAWSLQEAIVKEAKARAEEDAADLGVTARESETKAPKGLAETEFAEKRATVGPEKKTGACSAEVPESWCFQKLKRARTDTVEHFFIGTPPADKEMASALFGHTLQETTVKEATARAEEGASEWAVVAKATKES